MRRIENVRVFSIPSYLLKGAFAFPGVGIFVNEQVQGNYNLLRHEFGHILQFRKYGFLFFWFRIAPVSLFSATRSRLCKQVNHKDTWTEKNANKLAFDYFNQPANWIFLNYPVN